MSDTRTRTTQSKATDLLRAEAETQGFELVVDYDFANLGMFRFQRPDTLASALRIGFNFQTGGATLTLYASPYPNLPAYGADENKTAKRYSIDADESAKWAELLRFVRVTLRAQPKRRPA